jgi:coproporphyrinogen III oxidase-like Fe-S oxidoreductase
MAAGESVVESAETHDAEERRLERLFLGLRTTRGVPAEMIADRRGTAGRLIADGLAEEMEGRFALTRRGLPLADGVAARPA